MALATAIRYGVNRDTSVFIIKTKTFGGLAYAVLVSSGSQVAPALPVGVLLTSNLTEQFTRACIYA